MNSPRFLHASLLAFGLAAFVPITPAVCAEHGTWQFGFEGREIAVDSYPAVSKDSRVKSTLILLHGSSGPNLLLYHQQAIYFAEHGFTVVVPHFFDATKTAEPNPENYAAWARLLTDLTTSLITRTETAGSKLFLIGFSLGASVALAAGSQDLPVAAIAEWYGSLPDEFFYTFKAMPPLLILHGQRDTNIPVSNAQQLIKLCDMKQLSCENHIYPDQSHGFTGSALDDADSRTLEFFSRDHPAVN